MNPFLLLFAGCSCVGGGGGGDGIMKYRYLSKSTSSFFLLLVWLVFFCWTSSIVDGELVVQYDRLVQKTRREKKQKERQVLTVTGMKKKHKEAFFLFY